jgi:hypothetical protein
MEGSLPAGDLFGEEDPEDFGRVAMAKPKGRERWTPSEAKTASSRRRCGR